MTKSPRSAAATAPAAGASADGRDGARQRTAIVAGSLVVAAGVLFLGWSPLTVLALFWIENVVIGVFNVARLVLFGARYGATGMGGAALSGALFAFHYGLFCLGHGIAIAALFGEMEAGPNPSLADAPLRLLGRVLSDPVGWLALALVVATSWIDTRRWWAACRDDPLGETVERLTLGPYPRIFTLHLAVLVGAFLMQRLNAPAATVLVLVALKLAYDLRVVPGPLGSAPSAGKQD